MHESLSRAKAILLATHFASTGDINSFGLHAATCLSILRTELLLRIILTHLPETLNPSEYTPLLQSIYDGSIETEYNPDAQDVDASAVGLLSEEQALRRVKKLRLLRLACADAPTTSDDDPLTLFLFHRSLKIDRDAGMINLVPELLVPFVSHSDAIRNWLVSTIIPLSRRNFEYHPETSDLLSISHFQELPDAAAVDYLLSETSQHNAREGTIGRDLRGLLGPWLHHSARWPEKVDPARAPGWAHLLRWLLLQASHSWRVAVQTLEEYNGPADVDLGQVTVPHPQDTKIDHLLHSYLRAAMASSYSIPDSTVEGLGGSWRILTRVCALLDSGERLKTLEVEAQTMPDIPANDMVANKVAASSLRNDLLEETNPMTTPNASAIRVLRGVILSAFLLNRLGSSCSVRSAGELMLLRDSAEQKSEFLKVVRLAANNPHKKDDAYWSGVRNDVLWLHSWNSDPSAEAAGTGLFGMVPRRDLEIEILKAMLAASRKLLHWAFSSAC